MAEPGAKVGLAIDGAKAVYDRLSNDRAPYITRAEKNAQYTIPSLFPKESDNNSTEYATPYQSMGARGLNNMAAKMLLAILPVGESMAKLDIDEYVLKSQGAQSGDKDIVQKAALGLAMVERIILRYTEAAGYRPKVSEMCKQLLVAGNVLWYMPPGETGATLYKLQNFVVERDSIGNVIQTVVRDRIAYAALPEDIKKALPDAQDYEEDPTQQIEVYTHCYRDTESDQWLEYQEINGEVLETTNTYPSDASPWIPVRLFVMPGENYGRSFIEEYIGDLVSLENLSKAIVEFAIVASKVVFLVNPNSQTSVRKLAKSSNGDFIPGRLDDVQVFQVQKYADFQVASQTAEKLESRLSYAFLLNSAVQRNAERVTAEEIRYVSQELEATMGGVYSTLSIEWQYRVISRLLVELAATEAIPELPEEALKPKIITGLDAIGRGQDLNKLMTFQSVVGGIADKVSSRIDWDNFLLRAAQAAGIDTQGLILSDAELQQRQAQGAIATAMQQGGAAAGATMGQGLGAASVNPQALQQAAAGG
jgi:hypothetical protein